MKTKNLGLVDIDIVSQEASDESEKSGKSLRSLSTQRGHRMSLRKKMKKTGSESEVSSKTLRRISSLRKMIKKTKSDPTLSYKVDMDRQLTENEFDDLDSRKIEEVLNAAQYSYHFRRFVKQQFVKSSAENCYVNEENLKEMIELDFQDFMQAPGNASCQEIELRLLSARHVFMQFHDLKGYMNDAVRVHREGNQTLEEWVFLILEDYILRKVTALPVLKDTKITPREAAMIILWIDTFVDKMKETFPKVRVSAVWQSLTDKMIRLYLNDGVRDAMRDLIQRSRSLSTGEQLCEMVDGHAVSGIPKEIVFMVDSQLDAAKEKLPKQYVAPVLRVCNEEISNMACEVMLEIEANWRKLIPARFCSIINDTTRMMELMEERHDLHLNLSNRQEDLEDDVLRDLTELAALAANYLSERVIFDLCSSEPVLTSVGDLSWQNEANGTSMQSVVLTLKDCFEDLEQLLNSRYFFAKFLKRCFVLTVQNYVEAFYQNTMKHGVRKPAHVSHHLNRDYRRLVMFFSDEHVLQLHHGKAGFFSDQEVNSMLHMLQCLSRLMHPCNEASDLLIDSTTVLKKIDGAGKGGSLAILHLAGLRKPATKEETDAWIRMAYDAERTVATMDSGDEDISIKIPDLRFSEYVRHISKSASEDSERNGQFVPSKRSMFKQMKQSSLRTFVNRRREVPVFIPPPTRPRAGH